MDVELRGPDHRAAWWTSPVAAPTRGRGAVPPWASVTARKAARPGPPTPDPFACGPVVGGSCFPPGSASARGERPLLGASGPGPP